MVITILDSYSGRVIQYELEDMEFASDFYAEKFIEDSGYDVSNCQWMVHKNPEIDKRTTTSVIEGLCGAIHRFVPVKSVDEDGDIWFGVQEVHTGAVVEFGYNGDNIDKVFRIADNFNNGEDCFDNYTPSNHSAIYTEIK